MAYVGFTPQIGQYRKMDSLTFNIHNPCWRDPATVPGKSSLTCHKILLNQQDFALYSFKIDSAPESWMHGLGPSACV